MDEELNLINNDLNNVLSKLTDSNSKCKGSALQQRKQKIAMLITQHVQHLQQTVITNRRRRQQRMQRHLKRMRSFFMQQMIELQSKYMKMFVMLRMKHAQLQSAEDNQTNENPVTPQPSTELSANAQMLLFWEHKVPQYSNAKFLDSFHVTRSTFRSLCNQLSPTLRRAPDLSAPGFGRISPDKCMGLALYFLASGERISIISQKFALPRGLTIKCLKVFCNAVMSSLGKALRLLPQTEADCASVVAGFQNEVNMPAALVGILGVCCIPLRGKTKPTDGVEPSLRMEFLLDDRMLFRELQLGNCNGRSLSPLFSQTPNPLALLPPRCINKRIVPAFVLAPAKQNYPLRPWLLQRYPQPVAPHEYDFNEVADHLQELSDCALHRLMSRWRFLNQPLDISFQTASCIITAATVLHNLLEELSEPHMLEWGNSVDVSRFRAPPMETRVDQSGDVERAMDIRDFLARTISSTEI